MNNIRKFFVMTVSAILVTTLEIANAQSGQNTAEYLSPINTEFEAISKELWDYVKVVAKGKGAKKVDKKRLELITSVEAAKKKFQKMPGFQGDNRLKNALVSNMSLTNIVLKEEYGKILDMEEIAEQSYDLMEAYLLAKEMAGFKLDSANDVLQAEYKAFGETYNVNFQDSENKRSKQLKKANATLAYYNKVYLVFFKSYKQESYMIEALTNNDINSFEQNRQALISVSEEGISKLQDIGDYNYDKTLRYVCNRLMNFYIDEANNKMAAASEVFLKKENMEKMQQAFEAKRKNERTQADVNNVNNAINEYNRSLTSYNKTNESLNKTRAQLLNDWNKSVGNFLNSHAL